MVVVGGEAEDGVWVLIVVGGIWVVVQLASWRRAYGGET